MSRGTILTIEDHPPVRRAIVDSLRHAGFRPVEAKDAIDGEKLALAGGIDLVLLDVHMPGGDGFELLARIRKVHPTLPIIMLTARGSEEDRVRGLRGGADDYVVKPFGPSELLARVEAVLRRSSARPQAIAGIAIAGRTFDFERREARLADGSVVQLTERETDLVAYLARNPGRIVTRDELLRSIWNLDPRGVRTRTVDMHVARLRERIGDDPENPLVLVTVRGKGYKLAPHETAS